MFNEKSKTVELLDIQVDNLKKNLNIEAAYSDAGFATAYDSALDTTIGLLETERDRLTAVMQGIRKV
jgi:hypothetical protein